MAKIIEIATLAGIVPVKLDVRTNLPLEIINQVDSSKTNARNLLH